MNGALRVENYLLAAPAIDLGIALADASAKFADERRRIKEQRQKLDELYRLAEKETSPDQIMGIAAALKNYEETLAAVLVPVIRSAEKVISKRLPRGAPSSQQAFYRLSEEAADIAATWLELYQNTQIRLHLLRSEKLRAQGEAASPTFSNADEAIRYLKGSAGEN